MRKRLIEHIPSAVCSTKTVEGFFIMYNSFVKTINLSLVIPLHNEETICSQNIDRIIKYLCSLNVVESFEILAVENGSTDSTHIILKDISKKYPQVRIFHIPERGLGKAVLLGLENARYNTVMLMSIDISFGLNIIGDSIDEYLEGADMVLGSKGHEKSVYKASFSRVTFSKIYNLILWILFGIEVKDTQGTFLMRKSIVDTYIGYLVPDGAWIQTQNVIYAQKSGAKIVELPVKYIAKDRKSKFKMTDGVRIFFRLFKGRIEYSKWVKQKFKNRKK